MVKSISKMPYFILPIIMAIIQIFDICIKIFGNSASSSTYNILEVLIIGIISFVALWLYDKKIVWIFPLISSILNYLCTIFYWFKIYDFENHELLSFRELFLEGTYILIAGIICALILVVFSKAKKKS